MKKKLENFFVRFEYGEIFKFMHRAKMRVH